MPNYDFTIPVPIEGTGFVWNPYTSEDFFNPNCFSLNEWHNILDKINSRHEFEEYIEKYKNILMCFLLYKRSSPATPTGMCLLLDETGWYDNLPPWKVISVHGGGWYKDASNRFIYAKAWIHMVHFFNALGCKVLTDFNENNHPAKHLILNTGFTKNKDIAMYEYHKELDRFKDKG